MSEKLAVDTNAVADYLRSYRPEPPHLAAAAEVFLPLPVLGELYLGAFGSARVEENVAAVDRAAMAWSRLVPDHETARIYGRIAARYQAAGSASTRTERARRSDLWIAALCLQHKLPLLSNDRDFDGIEGLEVIHW
jgi:tRNA(fMet)-specific endonuclease VapC